MPASELKRCPSCGTFYRAIDFCPRDSSPLEACEGVVDRYRILERVGEGAMGEVYRAEHMLLDNRIVAIKLLYRPLSRDPEVVGRFFREAKAASRIDNKHIVEVMDFGVTEDGDSFLVMEYLDGPSLRQTLTLEGALSLKRGLMIGVQIADGVYAAHRKGIVHRDLKPENVVLVPRQNMDFVKLLDFGIAQLSEFKDDRLTRTGMVVGTPAYMSPEQAGGEVVDHRSDIYALGTILYEMLTGRCPFEGSTAKEVLVKKLTKNPVPPRGLRPDIPPSVEAVIVQTLHKDRAQRPQTMLDLVLELREALQQRSVGAGAPPLEDDDEEDVAPRPPPRLPAGTGSVLGGPLRRYLPLAGIVLGLGLGIGLTLLLSGKGQPVESRRAIASRSIDHGLPGRGSLDAGQATSPPRPDVAVARRRPPPGSDPRRGHPSRGRPPRHKVTAPTRPPREDPARVAPRPAPTSRWMATVLSTPSGADVLDENERLLGRTPVKVATDRARLITISRLGSDPHPLTLPAQSTRTFSVKLKGRTMAWEVMSLKQLKGMLDSGQISRFTYHRRHAELLKNRDQKLLELKVKLRTGEYTQAQYDRTVKAVNDSYR